MSKRNHVRYGSLPDDAEFEPEDDQPQFSKKQQFSNSPRQEKPPKNRSFFDTILKFVGKLMVLVFIRIPKSLFGLIFSKKNSSKSANFFRKMIVLGLKLGLALFILLIGYTLWISKDIILLDPNRLKERDVQQTTKIYDRTGEHLLYEIFKEERRTLVPLSSIPAHLKNGVIATEDTKFYQHFGIRPLSFARSVVYGIFGKGRIGGGASTLTQQLVKNAILTNEKTATRKLKEFIISIRLEQKFTKDEILQIYFNEIPYGSTNYGAAAAAQNYYGKSVSELNLEQSATLAGLPQQPSRFLNNLDALKERRNFVLRRMKEEGFITEEEMKTTQAEPLSFSRRVDRITAPHFVFYVEDKLKEMYGEEMVDTGGLTVLTSLDFNAQTLAEKAITDKEKLLEQAGANNAALVSLDPKNSQVLAYVGSKDFFNKDIQGQFDVVSFARRQPGSSIKPIIYAAAFEKGYTPETVLFDVVTNFSLSGTAYSPKNYTLKEYGPVTLRQALQGSLNIAAVKTFYLVGEKKGIEFASKLGYSTFNTGNFGLSLVLGGGEVKMLEHVHAYGVFANNGKFNDVASILKVTNSQGEVLYEWKQEEGQQVIDKKVATTLSSVLSDDASRAYIFGAGGPLTIPGRQVAAKTGTTNGYRDSWTVGYTPNIVTGVWSGNSDNKEMKAGYGGSRVSGDIWNSFMREYLKDKPVETFEPAPQNDTEKPVLRGSSGGGITLDVNRVTGRIATSSTPPEYIQQKTYIQPHDILHYVNKDDPRGPYPENPAQDPQYAVWEAAVQDWIKRKQVAEPDAVISFEEPPTEYDTEEFLQFVPTLTVHSPTPGFVFNSRNISTNIEVSAPRGVSKVSYFIDKRKIATVSTYPFHLSTYVRDLENGPHELTLLVEDDIGNRLERIIPITLQAEEESPYVSWVRGTNTITSEDFPVTFFLNPFKIERFRELRIYAQKNDEPKQLVHQLNDFSNMFNDQITFTWSSHPGSGNWKLSTEITDTNGKIVSGDTLDVIVN